MLPTGGGRTRNLLITSRTRIQLSHQGRQQIGLSKQIRPKLEAMSTLFATPPAVLDSAIGSGQDLMNI